MNGGGFGQFLRTRAGFALVLGVVTLGSVLLYLPTIDYGFVWDDTSLVTENRLLAESGPLEVFGHGFWAGAPDPPTGNARLFYRPLTSLSFWLDLKLAGLNPGYFHLLNVILNALCVALIALIIWQLLNSAVWAGIGALLFATHPAHVESVAFVSGRTDLLLTLFITVAAFGLLRALLKRRFWWGLLVPVGYALALLSKETALLFPVLVALTPLLTQTRYDRRHWIIVGACVLVGAAYLYLRGQVVGPVLAGFDPRPVIGRLNEMANDFGLYMRIFAWPFKHQVKFPVDPSFTHLTPLAITALLFAVTGPLLAAVRRRLRVTLWGYTWTILFLLPVLNIISIGPQAAERLVYLPSAGLVLMIVVLISRGLHTRRRLRMTAAGILLALSVAWGVDTLVRSGIWRNEATLYSTMTREAPNAPSAWANLANVVRETHPDSALRLYDRAIARDQGYVRAHINSGILHSQTGDHRRAVHHLRIADQLRPGSGQILNNLGLAFLTAGRPESALVYLDRALANDSTTIPMRTNHALALIATGDPQRAETELREILSDDPGFVPARLALVGRLERLGLTDSAAAHLELAVAAAPDRADHHNRLGTIRIVLGDSARALRCYHRALELDPDFVPALFNLAVLDAARGDTATALRRAARAKQLRPDVRPIVDLYNQLSVGKTAGPD